MAASSLTRRTALALLSCAIFGGCLPVARLNGECRWEEDGDVLPSGATSRRGHLVQDVRIAEALGVRYADARTGRGLNTPTFRELRRSCIERSLGELRARHGVTDSEIAGVTGARDWWIEVSVVLLPVAVLLVLASRIVATRVVAAYETEDRWLAIASLVMLVPAGAAVALGVAHMWAACVEMARVRDAHLSLRFAYLSPARHAWLLWSLAMSLSAAAAVSAFVIPARVPASMRRRHPRATS